MSVNPPTDPVPAAAPTPASEVSAPSATNPAISTPAGLTGELLQAAGAISVVAERGWTTTEFWHTVAIEGIGLATYAHWFHPSSDAVNTIIGAVMMVGPGAAYAISRGIRKFNASR